MSGERFPVLWIGRVAVVTLPVEIDVTNSDAVRGELLAVLDRSASSLVADLSTTNFCDSSGISALVCVYRRAESSGKAMRLVVSTPAVLRVLSITGVDQLIDVYPSVAASLGDPNGHADQPRPDGATATADADGGT